jgi:DNA-directed RNA polymerase specialized sigma24 family protein
VGKGRQLSDHKDSPLAMTQGNDEKLQIAQASTSTSGSASLTLSTPEGKENDDFEQRLANLPEQHREEILRQYDLPTSQATILTMLGFATWVEMLLMVAGTILSIGAGPSRL